MADTNEINMGAGSQAKQVAAAQNVSQTYIEKQIIESARRDFDARFSLPKPPRDFTGRVDEIGMLVLQLTRGVGNF